MPPLLCIAFGGSILTIGDILFKFWVEKQQAWTYGAGLLLYLVGAMFLVQSYKSQNIGIATALFILSNLASLSLVSWLYFGETLPIRKVVGLGVSAISVILMI
jgi:multidrug transporter EmrE-like cation transporter